MKNSNDTSWDRFVAQHLNHCATAVPVYRFIDINVNKSVNNIWPDDGSFEQKHVAEFLMYIYIYIYMYIVVLLTGIYYYIITIHNGLPPIKENH